jgi:hypothetical protein
MTEKVWLACADPEEMLSHLGESASQRKLRLFVCVWSMGFWVFRRVGTAHHT